MKKKKIGDEKNRDAKVLEWLHELLNDGGIYSRSDGNCCHCYSHLIFDEVNSHFICIGFAKFAGVWRVAEDYFLETRRK